MSYSDMMKTAYMAGVNPSEFWKLTPAELYVCVDAFVELETEKYNRELKVSYMNAYWTKINKLKPFDSYINKPNKAMTSEQMYKNVKMLNELFNGG